MWLTYADVGDGVGVGVGIDVECEFGVSKDLFLMLVRY